MPEVSGASRSETAFLLLGWFLSSSLGALVSILVSRLELPCASPLWGAALSGESCASEIAVSSARKTIKNPLRTPPLYRVGTRSKQPRWTESPRKSDYDSWTKSPPKRTENRCDSWKSAVWSAWVLMSREKDKSLATTPSRPWQLPPKSRADES